MGRVLNAEHQDVHTKAGAGRYQINPPPREELFWVTTLFTSHAGSLERMLHNGFFSLPDTLDSIPQSNATVGNFTCNEDMEQHAERRATAIQVQQQAHITSFEPSDKQRPQFLSILKNKIGIHMENSICEIQQQHFQRPGQG